MATGLLMAVLGSLYLMGIVVDPFDQLPRRAARIKRLGQEGPQQSFWRNRFPIDRRIRRVKLTRERLQRRVSDILNRPRRVDCRRSPLFPNTGASAMHKIGNISQRPGC
jgi:hypothetical protein